MSEATTGIVITGARENNLKDVSLRLPKDRIIVFTGVSGSGKSSVVFDTVAVEAQRQLNETFTWFVRNRLPKYERPEAETIDNLSAAIVVDQKPIGGNARSTVGTITDTYAVLRVLFSRYGTPSAGAATAYSFNDPSGMCPECAGLGHVTRLDLGKLLDEGKSLNEGAIEFAPMAVGTWQWQLYARSGLFDPDKPLRAFTPEERDLLLNGSGFRVDRAGRPVAPDASSGGNTYEGVAVRFDRLYVKRDLSELSERNRAAVAAVTGRGTCPVCAGARLNAAALATRVNGRSIAEYAAMEAADLAGELAAIDDPVGTPIAARAAAGVRRLVDIGLGYLSLDRETATLSGGESQRIKMVRHLGSALTGMTYVFDEPSVGLHPRDVGRLTALLRALRDKGNTVLVVEHDRDVIAVADHVVDLGPGSGAHGGQVVYEGTVAGLRASGTPTGEALRNVVPLKTGVRAPTGWRTVTGVSRHNLDDVTVRFPLGTLTAVTGVAGSGKSTLVGAFTAAYPDAVVVDQSAIGVSARSVPATYVGIMDPLRRVFARASGTEPGLFSFNSTGACPACGGRGVLHLDLAYMDPVTVTCEACGGRRFSAEALAHEVGGLSIADVLELTVERAIGYFAGLPALPGVDFGRRLGGLADVGLGYLTLGQPLSTLSGGERQRIKLADRLHRTGDVYVLDEPTTGLHMSDVAGLVALMDRLVDAGNSVLVIEHDLDVIKRADWVVDLGPDGGRHGGRVLFTGAPADLVAHPASATAAHLRRDLA